MYEDDVQAVGTVVAFLWFETRVILEVLWLRERYPTRFNKSGWIRYKLCGPTTGNSVHGPTRQKQDKLVPQLPFSSAASKFKEIKEKEEARRERRRSRETCR